MQLKFKSLSSVFVCQKKLFRNMMTEAVNQSPISLYTYTLDIFVII